MVAFISEFIYLLLFVTSAFSIPQPKQPKYSENTPLTDDRTLQFQHYELNARALSENTNFTLNSTVECIWSNYFGPYSDLQLKDCIIGPVPLSFTPPANLNETVISRDCFCEVTVPLSSFWRRCSTTRWMDVEDWFEKTCPERKKEFGPIDYKGIPTCAHDCLHDRIIEADCVSERRDCFCFWGGLFGCDLACGNKDAIALQKWRNSTCEKIPVIDLSIGESQGKRARLHRNLKPFAWYEIFSLTMIALSITTLLGFMVFEIFLNDSTYFERIQLGRIEYEKKKIKRLEEEEMRKNSSPVPSGGVVTHTSLTTNDESILPAGHETRRIE